MPIVANKEGWGRSSPKGANESSEINHQSLEPSLYSSIDVVGLSMMGRK
jgi:hypothetical protein